MLQRSMTGQAKKTGFKVINDILKNWLTANTEKIYIGHMLKILIPAEA
jgi:hypothetical protein